MPTPSRPDPVDAGSKSSVATFGPAEIRMFKHLQLIHDLLGGTDTMRDAREKWLPKEPAETLQAYNSRLGRSTLFNGLRRTIKSLVGRPFSKLISYDDQIPQQIQDLFGDIDLQGHHIDLFIRNFFQKGLEDGLDHLYVDMPVKPANEQTAADSMTNGRRPYWLLLDARRIVAHRMKVINGKPVLTHVRWREDISEPVGQWGEQETIQIRVIDAGTPVSTWSTWQFKDQKEGSEPSSEDWNDPDNWEKKSEGTFDLDEIPLRTFYTGHEAFLEARPPLIDLAWENVHHWQSKSDQANILKVARLPILFGKLLQTTTATGEKVQIVLGANTFVIGDDQNSDLKFVESNGKAIELGSKDLEDSENRMAIMGTEMLVRKIRTQSSAQTATQVALDNEVEYSDLSMMVRECEDLLANSIWLTAKWMNLEAEMKKIDLTGGGKLITINKDFGISLRDQADMQILLQARQAGQITQERFLLECQRRGLIDPAVDVDDEVQKTKLEGPPGMQLDEQNAQPVPGQQGEEENQRSA